VFIGAEYVVEGWRAIHEATRQDELKTDGIYALVRHPQYTGLFLIVFGEGIVHWPTIVSVVAFPVIVVAYTVLARKEERQMLEKFGDDYREYARRVPMLVPRSLRYRPQEV
jgi:protein-S-isoprenylcysteine O-methyltransferase Ste14